MKIAFLTREYPPDTLWGGPAVVYYNLAHALTRKGHDVHVICQAINRPGDFMDGKVFVHRVGTDPKRYSALARINYSFHAWLKLRELIKRYGVDVVEAVYWSAEGFLYSLQKRSPLVVAVQTSPRRTIMMGTYSGVKSLLGLKFLNFLANFAAKRADRIIVNSKATYDEVVKELKISPRKVVTVYHAVDTDRYRFVKSDIKRRLGIPEGFYVALFVGRLELRKGVHVLCEAITNIIRKIPTVKFVLVGKDTHTSPKGTSFKDYLVDKLRVENLLDNVMFLEFLSEEDLISLYSACVIFLLPSLHESFCLPIIEAMSCGKPVVTTPVGIVPELETYALKGLKVVPIGDVEKFAQAVIEFLSLRDEDRVRIGNENRELVKVKFSISAWANRILEVYKKSIISFVVA